MGRTEAVALGDVNGDGALDIVSANSNDNTATLLLGDGNGTFEEADNSPFAAGDFPKFVALGDMDDNGSLDIVVLNFTSGNITVLQRTQ